MVRLTALAFFSLCVGGRRRSPLHQFNSRKASLALSAKRVAQACTALMVFASALLQGAKQLDARRDYGTSTVAAFDKGCT